MKVSAVIPSYQGEKLLKHNLPAAVAALRDGDELVIVDDASPDQDGLDWVKKEFAPDDENAIQIEETPQYNLSAWEFTEADSDQKTTVQKKPAQKKKVQLSKKINFKLVKNKNNLRFGGSCNRGVEVATGELIFLLNNDVSPEKDSLKYLLPYFEKDDDVFAVACLEREQTSMGPVEHGKNILWFERGIFMHDKAPNFKKGETAWATGGSNLLSREKFLQLAGFDALFYPAYWEDIDLSWRAKKHGWKVLFEPKAKVDHNHESTNSTVFGKLQMKKLGWRNGDKFTWVHADIWQKIAFILWRPYWWWQRSKVSR